MKGSSRKIPSINRDFAAYPLRVAHSRIHGWGVFAAASIPRGRKVIEYTGEHILWPEAHRRLKKLLGPRGFRTMFMVRLNRLWRVDGAVGGSGAERINHSCNPNLFSRKIHGHILLYSRRRIRRGEEIAYDYRFSPKTLPVRCHCGSSKCRGLINRAK